MAFFSADITSYKLNNKLMKVLFNSIGQPLPSESHCRKIVTDIYNKEILKLRNYILNKPIFFIIDESDVCGNKTVNVLIVVLECPEKSYMADCRILDTPVNSQTIVYIINDVFSYLGVMRTNFFCC
ncbi:hypothetical protein A3Q56_02639 [Intoshia linei]|uniref:DUF4371 domain-containing protein n=1 Tax=Intoshia linei TaxID=1819745 RepID=A0A177B7A8_9BILA|nr:hypothetical protein A3Q56_02639 [Intoshia linei]